MRAFIILSFLILSAVVRSAVEYDSTLLYPPDDALVKTITVKFHDGTDLSDLATSYSTKTNSYNLVDTDEVGGLVNLLGGQEAYATVGDEYVGLPAPLPDQVDSIAAIDYRLGHYFTISLGDGRVFRDIKDEIAQINAYDNVEIAYANVPTPPPATPSFYNQQDWLRGGNSGIKAPEVWEQDGGLGDGIRIIDLEYSYTIGHEDLPHLFYDSGGHLLSTSFTNYEHGTAVLGQLGAKHNGLGVSGIAPNASLGFQSSGWRNGNWEVAPAILNAAKKLRYGDILLIEQQSVSQQNTDCGCSNLSCGYGPPETSPVVHDTIKKLTRQGIIVVEPAGNGHANLDHAVFEDWFSRSNDSGAIIVAASDTGHGPNCYTTYGSRIDMHGIGENVVTAGYGNLYNAGQTRKYTNSFGGTSSSAPMVAGAAALVQSLLKERGKPLLSPSQMRSLLVSTGTVQKAGTQNEYIGNFPNVVAAAEDLGITISDDILLLIIPILRGNTPSE